MWGNKNKKKSEHKSSFFTSRVVMWIIHILGVCLALTLIAFGIHYFCLKKELDENVKIGVSASLIVAGFILGIAYLVIAFISYLIRVLNNSSPCEVPHN